MIKLFLCPFLLLNFVSSYFGPSWPEVGPGQKSKAFYILYVPCPGWYNIGRIKPTGKELFHMKTIIKLPFKILAIPFVVAFFIMGAVMRFLGWLSGRILVLVSLLFGVGGVILLCQGNTYSGIGIIVIAFLISPFGVPAIAEGLAKMFSGFNRSLAGFIAS